MSNSAIIITGAAGFIGSCMVQYLNQQGSNNLILIDDFESSYLKNRNWENKKYKVIVQRDSLLIWLKEGDEPISSVIHLGARADTTEFDYSIHERLNFNYSKDLWHFCSDKNIPLIYASSASTYGAGELGYNDNIVEQLKPLYPYGVSKNKFDKWALGQSQKPSVWAGLKFFNVYGPNEYHKGRMASLVWHAFNQISATGQLKHRGFFFA